MEVLLRDCASYVALAAERRSAPCIAVGMVETLVRSVGRGEAEGARGRS